MKDIIKNVFNKIKEKGNYDVEVFARSKKRVRIFFEKNELKTLHEDEVEGIGIRVIKDGKLGFASTNVMDDESVENIVNDATVTSEIGTKDIGNVLTSPSEYTEIKGLYSKEMYSYNLPEVMKLARTFFRTVKDYDKRISLDSANVELTVLEDEISNSLGLSAKKKKTMLMYLLFGMAIDGDDISSFDYRFGVSTDLNNIEEKLNSTALQFATSVINSLGAHPCKSFNGLALLSPQVVAALFGQSLSILLNGEHVLRKRSPFHNKLNEVVGNEKLTILDNPLVDNSPYSSVFDREGTPTKKLVLIENGVLKNFIHNNYSAKHMECESTGHASGDFSELPAIELNNLEIPGQKKLEEITKTIDQGVFINRFSGNANPINGIVSGTVKGGWFINDGRREHPLTGVMMGTKIFEMFNNVIAISRETEQTFIGELPYILVDKVSFTGE
ncbi:MAG: TldD/PmbA family protein [Kosmotoga sp.]|nr:MAG: TldD/PmbA family protein [Kosmotoga sp.]